MKGSPILSTLTAIVIMLGSYFAISSLLNSHISPSTNPNKTSINNNTTSELSSAFLEMHFSTPPASLVISDPITNHVIAKLSNLTDHEWNGEIMLPNKPAPSQLELSVKAAWDKSSAQQHFIQIIVSPDQADDAAVTLRSMDHIDTTATFNWN